MRGIITRGIIIGAVASTIGTAINAAVLLPLGITKISIWNMAAAISFGKGTNLTSLEWVVAFMSFVVASAIIGVVFVLTVRLLGTSDIYATGPFVFVLSWMTLNLVLMPIVVPTFNAKPDANTIGAIGLIHIGEGLIAAYLYRCFADRRS